MPINSAHRGLVSGFPNSAPIAPSSEFTTLRPPLMNLSTGPLEEQPLVAQALTILDTELPEDLWYHNREHTVSVISKVVQLAHHSRLPDRDTELLTIAAAWHDTGYRTRRHENEPLAAAWVAEAMSERGRYSDRDVQEVQQAILDTQMKPRPEDGVFQQVAQGRLSPWLLDADVANFGSKNFFPVSFRLLREIEGSVVQSPHDLTDPKVLTFFRRSSQLLDAHRWQTDSANELFQPQKGRNQHILSELIGAINEQDPAKMRLSWLRMLPYPDAPYQLVAE